MPSDDQSNWYRRTIGARIDRALNIVIGMALFAVGAVVLVLSTGSDDFAVSSHWAGVAIGIGFVVVALFCLRARRSIIEELGTEQTNKWGKDQPND